MDGWMVSQIILGCLFFSFCCVGGEGWETGYEDRRNGKEGRGIRMSWMGGGGQWVAGSVG